MWFRNLRVYRFTRDIEFDEAGLSAALAEHAFSACERQAFFSTGWVPPMGGDAEDLVHAGEGSVMVCLAREDKILPASVINEALREKVEEIREQEDREVRRRERLTLKDEITTELLPRAFTRMSWIRAYIDMTKGWLVIDAASLKKAEELINALRTALGSCSVVPMRSRTRPAALMTSWVTGSLPADLEAGDECEMIEPGDDGGIIRCKHVDLNSEEISVHIDAGKYISRLSLNWAGRIDCQLCEDMAIKRLGFDDIVQAGSEEIEDAAARFDADFVIMCQEIRNFLDWLLEQADGVDLSEDNDSEKAA